MAVPEGEEPDPANGRYSDFDVDVSSRFFRKTLHVTAKHSTEQ